MSKYKDGTMDPSEEASANSVSGGAGFSTKDEEYAKAGTYSSASSKSIDHSAKDSAHSSSKDAEFSTEEHEEAEATTSPESKSKAN